MAEKADPTSNSSFSWSSFDSEAYFQHYYSEPHPDDERLVALACAALHAAAPAGKLDVVDVGTGPNLLALLCALPAASRLTAWEYSSSNIAWLEAEVANAAVRSQWQHFWKIVAGVYGPDAVPLQPIPALKEKLSIQQGSIYELPKARWDAATMFFCAESITGQIDEFRTGCTRFAESVRPGGTLVGAFLVGSSAYSVAGRPFPILSISEADLREVFAPLTTELVTEPIGIVEKEIRSGYSGMVFLTARARA